MKHLIRIICVAVTLFLIIGCSSSDNGAKSENQTTTVSGNMTVKVEPENKVDSPKKPIILNASMILIGKALPREERETTENVKADAKGKRIPLPAGKNTRTDEEMAKIADKVIMKLKQGADFGAVARAYSDHSSGLYGGRLGNIAVEKFTPELLAEIQKLKVGEFSKMPVKTPVGLVIYRRDKAEQTVNLSALLIVIGHTGSPNKLKGATRDQKEALDLAKELTDKIKNGADFATLAKKYSDHSTGALGGDIGVIKSNQLPPAVAKELKNLKIGQVTPTPFDSPMGYHIMQRKKPARYLDLAASLILVSHRDSVSPPNKNKRTAKEAEALAKDLIKKLQSGSDFAKLADKYSDHYAKKPGGNFGVFKREAMHPQIIAGILELKESEISNAPLETPIGYFVIKRQKAVVEKPSANSIAKNPVNAPKSAQKSAQKIPL